MSDERNNKDSLRTALRLLPDCAAPRPAVLRCAVCVPLLLLLLPQEHRCAPGAAVCADQQ